MTSLNATALGILDTQTLNGLHGVISVNLVDDQSPEGDGNYLYWMMPGEIYGFVYDGVSWTVSGGSWTEPGHTYRLMRKGWAVTAVPTLHGDESLDPGRIYQTHLSPDGWELWRLDV